jgi:hypothetical protein
MRWVRDVVADHRNRTGNAGSLLTATTPAMAAGMVEDQIETPVLAISSDAIAATVIGTAITSAADAVIAIGIGTTDAGAAGGKSVVYPHITSI